MDKLCIYSCQMYGQSMDKRGNIFQESGVKNQEPRVPSHQYLLVGT